MAAMLSIPIGMRGMAVFRYCLSHLYHWLRSAVASTFFSTLTGSFEKKS